MNLYIHLAGKIRNSENQPRVWNFLTERAWLRVWIEFPILFFLCRIQCSHVFAVDVVVVVAVVAVVVVAVFVFLCDVA